MKNPYCDINEGEIKKLPERFQPYLFSKFWADRGCVQVPEETFKEMVDLIIEYAHQDKALEDAKATLEDVADRMEEFAYQELSSALNP